MAHHLVEIERRALELKNSGSIAEAAVLFARIVKEQPDWEHGTALHNLAQCYEDLGRNNEAEHYYREALKCEPENDIFVSGLESFLFLRNKPE